MQSTLEINIDAGGGRWPGEEGPRMLSRNSHPSKGSLTSLQEGSLLLHSRTLPLPTIQITGRGCRGEGGEAVFCSIGLWWSRELPSLADPQPPQEMQITGRGCGEGSILHHCKPMEQNTANSIPPQAHSTFCTRAGGEPFPFLKQLLCCFRSYHLGYENHTSYFCTKLRVRPNQSLSICTAETAHRWLWFSHNSYLIIKGRVVLHISPFWIRFLFLLRVLKPVIIIWMVASLLSKDLNSSVLFGHK